MPTPLYVGSTGFREIETNPTVNRGGLDTLTVTLKGRVSDVPAELSKWRMGVTYPGYPNMYLESRSLQDKGPIVELSLNFTGFIDFFSHEGGLIGISDKITEQSVTLNTDEDENVTFAYFAQSTSYRWISKSLTRPGAPKFRGIVPASFSAKLLFRSFPPNYKGSISGRYKLEGRLSEFTRDPLARGVWAVTETWENLVEPTA